MRITRKSTTTRPVTSLWDNEPGHHIWPAKNVGIAHGTSHTVHAAKAFELIPGERGKSYTVKHAFTVYDERGRALTIREAFKHDRYSIVPDLPDPIPAIAHDYACDANPKTGSGRKWDDGSDITRADADALFAYLMRESLDEKTQRKARLYGIGIRIVGAPLWYCGSLKRALLGVFSAFKP